MASRKTFWLVVWAMTLVVAAGSTWMWAAGRADRLRNEAWKAYQEGIAEAEGLVVAAEEGKRDLKRRWREAVQNGTHLSDEVDRLQVALGVALQPVDVVAAATEASTPDPEVIRDLLPCPEPTPLDFAAVPDVFDDVVPEPLPWYATATAARLESDAGAMFAVGEVVLRVQEGDAPELSDPVLWSGLWRAEATELFRVEEPELRRWRLTLLAGLTTDPGYAIGAAWQGRRRLGVLALYSQPFESGSTQYRRDAIVVEDTSATLTAAATWSFGRP